MYLPLIQGSLVCKWTNDSQRLILEHFDAICNSPSQLYSFALPFSPSSSWLCKYYTPELLQAPKVVRGTKVEWGPCSRTVSLDSTPLGLSYWNNIIAVGLKSGDIIILDTTTGSQMATLSGHISYVTSVAFSLDGRLLVSGSYDKTVKLWDVQTGGVINTFCCSNIVLSVSISADCTKIASGLFDNSRSINGVRLSDSAICLWNIQTGRIYRTIRNQGSVYYIGFLPTDPLSLISISNSEVCQWDVNGYQISPTCDGTHIAFSPDHGQFALCNGKIITVQNSYSKAIVAQFSMADALAKCCCFSPNGRLVVVAADHTAYVWDITTSDPHLIETLVGHTDDINSLVFSSSSLISASGNGSVKFWKLGVLSTDLVITNPQPTSPTLAELCSVSLQAKDGIVISSDLAGVVKTWDISTGICKASFQTSARDWSFRDAQLIDGRVIFVWHNDCKIHIWDTERGELLQTLDTTEPNGLRISGDGSKIIFLGGRSIQVWSMQTWELVGEVEVGLEGGLYLDFLSIDGLKVCIHSTASLAQEGWDFGILDSSPIPFNPSTGRPHLDIVYGTGWQTGGPFWVKDTVTGNEVFQLSGIYAEPNDLQWDGQYLAAGYGSGEVLILDFQYILSRDI